MRFLTFNLLYFNLLFQLHIASIVTCNNADRDKDFAVKQNRGKSGIYRRIRKKSGKVVSMLYVKSLKFKHRKVNNI